MINNKLVLGIVGSRKRNTVEDFKKVKKKFLKYFLLNPELIICSGLAVPGADLFAHQLAHHFKCNMLWFPAKWEVHGKWAGFRRNTYIAEMSDILIAVPTYNRIGGTEDTIKKFIKYHSRKNLILIREKIKYG